MIIEIDNITESQKIAIEIMLYQFQSLGQMGGSRWVCFYSDGDGNFHSKIKVDGRDPIHTKSVSRDQLWETGECRIDFDSINLEKEDK